MMIEFEDGHIVVGEAIMGAAVLLFSGAIGTSIWGITRLVKRIVRG